MKRAFSNKWKASSQPRKQRKHAQNAPLHMRSNMVRAHLAKDLQQKYGRRSIRIRAGDRVKIMRGEFRGQLCKVDRVDVARQHVYCEKIQAHKKDGSKVQVPLVASNLTVVECDLSDPIRKQKISGKSEPKKTEPKKEAKKEPKQEQQEKAKSKKSDDL